MGYAVNLNMKKLAQSAQQTGKGRQVDGAKTSAASNLKRATLNRKFDLDLTPNVTARRAGLANRRNCAVNYGGYRVQSNAGRDVMMPVYQYPPQTETVVEKKNSFWENLAETAISAGMMVLNAKINASTSSSGAKSVSSNSPLDTGTSASQPYFNDSDVSSTVSDMANATDSATLRQNISSAKQKLDGIKAKLADSTAKTKYNEAKKSIQQKTKAAADAKAKLDAAKQKQTQAKQSVDACKDRVQSATQNVQAKTEALGIANENYNQAVTNRTNKESEIAGLKSQLASASSEEEKAAIQAKINTAQDELTRLKQEEEKAKNALDQADKDKIAADKDLQAAQRELEKQQGLLDKAVDAKSQADDEVKTANDEKEKADQELETAQTTVKEYESLAQDQATLEAQIKDYEGKLPKMEKEEKKKLAQLQKQIDKDSKAYAKNETKIDATDGMSNRETRRREENEQRLTNIKQNTSEAAQLKDNVAKSNLLAGSPTHTTAGGNKCYSGELPSGRMVYFVDGREVDEATYRQYELQ